MGMLFMLLVALVLGTALCYLLGLGSLGRTWHLGIGVGGIVLSWVMLAVLPLPRLMRVSVSGWTVDPVWAALGTFMVALVVGISRKDEGG